MTCDQAGQVHAYYDGELSSASRAEVESHLAACADCRELLEELKQMTNLLATVSLPDVPQSATNRMRGAWWAAKRAQEVGVRRLAGWMTAAAAAILVLVPLYSSNVGPDSEDHVSSFEETLAFIPPAQSPDSPDSELTRVVQWMADDLAGEPAGDGR